MLLKLNHILFWWYYKRVPEFFNQWTILKSLQIYKQNYEHKQFVMDQNSKLIQDCIKREEDFKLQISNLQLKVAGVPQQIVDPLNEMLGLNLKGL